MLPHRAAMGSPEGVEEERRVAHVAVTRAADRLYLTWAERRRMWHREWWRVRSKFLECEVPGVPMGPRPERRPTHGAAGCPTPTRQALPQLSWEQITEPGAYVEIGTGDLYRIPQEALIRGASPVTQKQSSSASRLVQVSKNPFCTTLEARLKAAEHNIQPNF